MRPLASVGIVIGPRGAFVFMRGVSFTPRRDGLEVGDVRIPADGRRSIPPRVAGRRLLEGISLIVAGVRRGA